MRQSLSARPRRPRPSLCGVCFGSRPFRRANEPRTTSPTGSGTKPGLGARRAGEGRGGEGMPHRSVEHRAHGGLRAGGLQRKLEEPSTTSRQGSERAEDLIFRAGARGYWFILPVDYLLGCRPTWMKGMDSNFNFGPARSGEHFRLFESRQAAREWLIQGDESYVPPNR